MRVACDLEFPEAGSESMRREAHSRSSIAGKLSGKRHRCMGDMRVITRYEVPEGKLGATDERGCSATRTRRSGQGERGERDTEKFIIVSDTRFRTRQHCEVGPGETGTSA